jgi:acyl transferase domain-containing protein
MARSLFREEQFRTCIVVCNEVLRSLGARWSVQDELSKDVSTTRVNDAILSQPICTIIKIALVHLLESWNILPAAVLGHSSGEVAAAYSDGFLSLNEAITNAYFRRLSVGTGQEKDDSCREAMVAIRSTHSKLAALLRPTRYGIGFNCMPQQS